METELPDLVPENRRRLEKLADPSRWLTYLWSDVDYLAAFDALHTIRELRERLASASEDFKGHLGELLKVNDEELKQLGLERDGLRVELQKQREDHAECLRSLTKERESLRGQLAESQSELDHYKARALALEAERDNLRADRGEWREKLEQLLETY